MPIRFLKDRTVIATQIQNLFRDSTETYCIVAFWGTGAKQLFSGMSEQQIKGTRIVCNLTMGGTNPSVIKNLQGEEFQIRHNPALHSKIYWTKSGVIVGSANASVNGLSLEGRDQDGWLEAAIFSDRKSEIDATNEYVREIWCKSKTITPLDMQNAHQRWRRRRPFPSPRNDLTFLEALTQGRFSGRPNCIYVCVSGEDLTDRRHMENQAAELQRQYLELGQRDLDAWEGWPDIPRNHYIVDHSLNNNNGLTFENIWRTLPKKYDRPAPQGRTYQFAYSVNPAEIGMIVRQREQMTRIMQCIVGNGTHREWLREQGDYICLERLLDRQVNDCLE